METRWRNKERNRTICCRPPARAACNNDITVTHFDEWIHSPNSNNKLSVCVCARHALYLVRPRSRPQVHDGGGGDPSCGPGRTGGRLLLELLSVWSSGWRRESSPCLSAAVVRVTGAASSWCRQVSSLSVGQRGRAQRGCALERNACAGSFLSGWRGNKNPSQQPPVLDFPRIVCIYPDPPTDVY